ncbi:radical SAM protein [bacterium]|nr:radical SAM protein [bacterium]
MHPAGKLSPMGVLDVGRKCPHSCCFCFYSFYDKSEKQFNYLRTAEYLSTESLKNLLRYFAQWGLTHFEYTGGEPSLHPDIVEITRYAHKELGLKGRMITMGQFLGTKLGGSSEILLDRLLEAGLNDFLFSFHTVDAEMFHKLTGADLGKLQSVMKTLDDRGFSYCTNTVVEANNYKTLPDTARYLVSSGTRYHNFLIMRLDWGWANNNMREEMAVGYKAKYNDIDKYIKEATDILVAADIAVNIRYAPYCMFKGYEKHIVGFKGAAMDPYEWRNGTKAASEGEPLLKCITEEDNYTKRIPLFESDPAYNLAFSEKCEKCAVRPICDGVDRDYVARHGWDEFEPLAGEQIKDVVHFRYEYPGPFIMKEEQYERSPRKKETSS